MTNRWLSLCIGQIPNILTCANLLCGCMGLVCLQQNKPEEVVYWIGGSFLFDFLDGFVARLLGVQSPMGKELDSLADMISFGVLPSFLMQAIWLKLPIDVVWSYQSFAIVIFSAIRLALFNLDERQKTGFIGVPTPANTLFLIGIWYTYQQSPAWFSWPLLCGLTWFSALSLVAQVPLLALKFSHYQWRGNEFRYLLIASSLGWLALGGLTSGLLGITLSYFILSLIAWQTQIPSELKS